MSIDAILERIAVSLETLVTLADTKTDKPAAATGKKAADPKPAAKEPEAKPLAYADAAAVVQTFVKKKGKPAALEVLAPFGIDNTPGKKLTDAKPEQWAPIIEAFNAATLVTPDA